MAKKKQSTVMSADAIAALRASRFEGNAFYLTEEKLACYSEIKALVVALGGKWVSGRKAHVFNDGVDAKGLVLAACDRGEIPASNPNAFFPTPSALVDRLVGESDFAGKWAAWMAPMGDPSLSKPLRYLEPSGGAGALVEVLASRLRPGDELVVVEFNPILAAALRTKFPQATVIEGDFLEFTSDKPFDVVLMNPPFAGKTYQKHVRHAFSMLTPRGVLAAIVPSSLTMHGDDFLYFLAEAGRWEDFGGEHFEGTAIATSGLWIQNDPERFWREEPHNGYQTHHAWNITIAASSDQAWLKRMNAARSLEEFESIISSEVSGWVRDGNATRVDRAIVLDVLRSLVEDYGDGYGIDNLGKLMAEVTPLKQPAKAKAGSKATQMDLLEAVA